MFSDLGNLICEWVSVSPSMGPNAIAESQNLWIMEIAASSFPAPSLLLSTCVVVPTVGRLFI